MGVYSAKPAPFAFGLPPKTRAASLLAMLARLCAVGNRNSTAGTLQKMLPHTNLWQVPFDRYDPAKSVQADSARALQTVGAASEAGASWLASAGVRSCRLSWDLHIGVRKENPGKSLRRQCILVCERFLGMVESV